MDKKILVMNNPECCEDCPCCHNDNNDYYCRIDFHLVDWEKISDECPLIDLPERLDGSSSTIEFQKGWNACLDTILKEVRTKD